MLRLATALRSRTHSASSRMIRTRTHGVAASQPLSTHSHSRYSGMRALQRAQQQMAQLTASQRSLQYHTRAPLLSMQHTAASSAPASGSASTDSPDSVSIGTVRVTLPARTPYSRPDLVPTSTLPSNLSSDSQETLSSLQWMMRKHSLGQDIFLLGPPGPQKRRLALRFAEVIQREVEYVSISRDTTEADLKQRAEVVQGSLHFIDQPPVRCALFGRLLVLDGLEKAERNVLPTLNNLLENRELSLEDGRFLMHHKAFDALRRERGYTLEEMAQRKLLRCHEDFRVIALGLPVPRFPGYALDPPLRSRFQARAILPLPLLSQLEVFAEKYPRVDRELLSSLLSARETLRIFESENALSAVSGASGAAPTKMPHFPSTNLEQIVSVLDTLPTNMQPAFADIHAIHSAYPFTLMCDTLQAQTVLEALDRFQLHRPHRVSHPVSGRSTIQPLNLSTEPHKLFVKNIRPAAPIEPQANANEQTMWDTPHSLTSTPAETAALVAAQKRLPTSADLPASNPALPAAASGDPTRPTLRLPRGRLLEVTLTTSSADGGTATGEAAVEHKLLLEGSVVHPGSASAQAAASSAPVDVEDPFIVTAFHRRLLAPLLLSLSSGRDLCILGGRGLGKSSTARWIAGLLGFSARDIHTVHLFKDMSSRDLLQRRGTDQDGNTIWTSGPIINAALTGGLAILDGLDRIPPATLQVLRRLIEDRELTLFDGTRLLRSDRYEAMLTRYSRAELDALRIFPVLPSFRIIALANPPQVPGGGSAAGAGSSRAATGAASWLLEETLPLFSFHALGDSLDEASRSQILRALFPKMAPLEMQRVMQLVELLGGKNAVAAPVTASASASASTPASFHFSLRQCIQLLRHHAFYPADLVPHIRRMLLHEFLPATQKALLDSLIASSDFGAEDQAAREAPAPSLASLLPRVENGLLHIGSVSFPLNARLQNPELVPNILFFNIPSHLLLLQDLLRDWIVDSASSASTLAAPSHRRHLLLVGNQGTGKNKVTDRLLELLKLEREYMQLHRDTSVQALTLSPSLKEGRVFYEDSALVRSVRFGRVLVIDEADKAPLEVVAVLKGLVAEGELSLSDGRKIVHALPAGIAADSEEARGFIVIHPAFRLIVLANRPGFPFLGNDFFRDNGDVYSCHAVPNPDPASEIELLEQYAPNVPRDQIRALVDAFTELRHLVLEQTFTYPYSTRELVAIVRHLQSASDEGLLAALDNVLDFDRFDPQAMRNLKEVFARHGIPLISKGQQADVQVNLASPEPLPQPKLVQSWTSTRPGASRSGLSSNPTAATTTTASSMPGANLATRFFSSAAAAVGLRAPTPAAVDPSAASSALPSLVTSAPISGRSWSLHLDGHVRSNDSFENSRLRVFSEEKASWKVPLSSTVSRPLSLAVLGDDSVHVLTSSYLCLTSYFPRVSGGYHKMISIELEDFLPLYEIAEDSLQMIALPALHTVAIFAPSHSMLLLIAFTQPKEGAADTTAAAAASSLGSSAASSPAPKATASVIVLQAPAVAGGGGKSAGSNLSTAFLEYLTPGFKMPRWHSRAGHSHLDGKDAPKPFQTLDALANHGLLIFLQPQARFFMYMDLSAESIAKADAIQQQQQHGSSKGLSSNPVVAVSKLPSRSSGALSVVDVSAWLGPHGSIEKLVALSPSLWIIESADQRRFVSTGASDGWKWSQIATGAASGTSEHGSFVAHEHGWHYSPASNLHELDPRDKIAQTDGKTESPAPTASLPRRFKPLQGYPMDHLAAAGTVVDAVPSIPIPSAHAIFIPRQPLSIAAPPTPAPAQSTSSLLAAKREVALLAPPAPSSLYRFAAGGLFEGAAAADSAVPAASSSPLSASPNTDLYEVAFPEASALRHAESLSAEAAYHSWLSTLLPSSSQLAMPSYFTYHMPAPGPQHTGPWISKIEQPVLSVVDLFGRQIKHVPIRVHEADLAANVAKNAPISVERFLNVGAARRPTMSSSSSFRSRRESEDAKLDAGLNEQALEESLGVPAAASSSAGPQAGFSWHRDRILSLRALPMSGDLVTLQANGRLRLWEVDPRRLVNASSNWRRLFGLNSQLGGSAPLRLELDSDRKKAASAPKVGKVDAANKPHVGGNQWKGGTGGADTAGLGGKGGPYRFDAGHDVHQISPEEKAKVSDEVAKAAKELGRTELAKRLNEIDMAAEDHQLYSQYMSRISKQLVQLRLILEQSEAKQVEREWLRNQREGDLDDSKIVDAITGERMVYRKRGKPLAQMGLAQRLPKRLQFVMDVSGSMYRFNGSDQRLERLLEATMLMMESLDGFEAKFSYSITGHSGDAAAVPFVPYGAAPKSRKERLQVLQRMMAHSQYCSSGDHTLEAVAQGVAECVSVEADDYLTIIVSDANLRRYGISPASLGAALQSEPRVQAYVIFIASLEGEVSRILPHMPPGKAFFCSESAMLPAMMRTILTASDIVGDA